MTDNEKNKDEPNTQGVVDDANAEADTASGGAPEPADD